MKIYIPGKGPITIYPSGGRFVGVPGEGPVTINKAGFPGPWIANEFASPGSYVGMMNEWENLTRYYSMVQDLGNDRFLSYRFKKGSAAFAVGQEAVDLVTVAIKKLYGAYNDDDAAITKGGAWSVAENAAYFGGRLFYTGEATRYVELTTPAGVTEVGLYLNIGSSGGISKVTIDGDATLATGLPTAQDLVTAGTLADTVLVANGGSLNPTDRVTNHYTGNTSVIILNSSLTPDVHTVRLTATGYKQAAASGTNVLIYALLAWGPGVFNLSHPLWYFTNIETIHSDENNPIVWDISYNFQPEGATYKLWLGHAGQMKYSIIPVLTVDGVEKTLAQGSQFYGTELTWTMQFDGRHAEIDAGATNVCTVDMTFTLNKATGLTIAHQVEWLMNGVANGYPCMMQFGKILDRARAINGPVITMSNSGNYLGSNTEQAMYAWDYNGNIGALMYIPDLQKTVLNWIYGGSYDFCIKDSAVDAWYKIYATRYDSDGVYENGTIWQSEANYRIKWFEDGADAVLGQ